MEWTSNIQEKSDRGILVVSKAGIEFTLDDRREQAETLCLHVGGTEQEWQESKRVLEDAGFGVTLHDKGGLDHPEFRYQGVNFCGLSEIKEFACVHRKF